MSTAQVPSRSPVQAVWRVLMKRPEFANNNNLKVAINRYRNALHDFIIIEIKLQFVLKNFFSTHQQFRNHKESIKISLKRAK